MRRRFLLLTLLGDTLALGLGLVVGSAVIFGTPLPWEVSVRLGPLAGMLASGLLLGSYMSLRMWLQTTPRASYGRALAIVGIAAAFTAVGLVISREYWSRPFLGVTLATWLLGSLAIRAVRRRRPWVERAVLITAEKGLVDDLRNSQHLGVESVFDPAGDPPSGPFDLDTTLVVDLRPVMSERMASFVASSNLAGAQLRSLTSVYEEHTGRLPMVHLAEGWELSAPVSRNQYADFKRTIDFFLTVVTAPLWIVIGLIIWVAVKIDSRGPAIYTQERVGHDHDTFTLYKFRTMIVDAERNGPQFASTTDDRLTRVGRWLRRIRLDEIPQLWNVLRGDLSLVGPRPERPVWTEQFEETIPFYGYRHLIRPGVTGWAQVNYGYADDEADTIDKLTYDLYYVKHMSLWLDLRILGSSMWTVLSGFGAR
ncbi:MAG: hypothetical protein GY720_13125 [bacterium]|nr:hypothetical protein [bacterium]